MLRKCFSFLIISMAFLALSGAMCEDDSGGYSLVGNWISCEYIDQAGYDVGRDLTFGSDDSVVRIEYDYSSTDGTCSAGELQNGDTINATYTVGGEVSLTEGGTATAIDYLISDTTMYDIYAITNGGQTLTIAGAESTRPSTLVGGEVYTKQ